MKMSLSHSQVTLSYFFFIIIVIFSTFLFAAIATADDDAVCMSQLMKALTPTPPGWSNNTHLCKWNGILCNETSKRVSSITLPSSSLTGTLPSDINTLTYLAHIDLHNNSLTGPLPSFSELTSLETILLGHNNFTSVPEVCFMMLPGLTTLNLSNNMNLTPWLFPTDLTDSVLLHTLDFQATNLLGSLPSNAFVSFPNLETVVLSHNKLKGSLPESLERSPIKYLKLDNQGINTGFSGTIEIISTMRNLSQVWLNNNIFQGFIPDLSNCTHLFDLQLHSNGFYGVVPPSLMRLSSLKNLSLHSNWFQGPKPVFHKD